MDPLEGKLDKLSPAKRRLLEARLKKLGDADAGSDIPRRFVDDDELAPPSFAQKRLWFMNQYDPQSIVHNSPLRLNLTGPLDIDVLQRCVQTIFDRHEVYRMRFVEVDMAGALAARKERRQQLDGMRNSLG